MSVSVSRCATAWLYPALALLACCAFNFGIAEVRGADREKPEYLDRMIQEGWESAEPPIQPSARASDSEFVRRAYLDVLGRIPNLQETIAFLDNKDSGKREKLVETLLSHPDYPKNFGTIWRVALIGRGGGQNNRVNAEALESWLRVQFTDNRPWNEVVRDLVTASGSNKDNGATNFVLAHMDFDKVPLTAFTTRVFLGQQIQCTQCHDHPSNDWKQADFWGINAFHQGINSRTVSRTDSTGAEVDDYTELLDRPTDSYAKFDRNDGTVRIVFPTYLDGTKISQNADVNRREELGRFLTEEDGGQLARAFVNRIWGHFLGRGFVHPVDDFGDQNPPSHPELLDRLASDFQEGGYNVKNLIRWIMTSEPYQLTSARNRSNEMDETLFSHMNLKPLTPEQLFESLLTATQAHKAGGAADSENRRNRWLRQFIFTFATDEATEDSSFQGTIPQALMMMNGDLMKEAISNKPGSFLRELLEQSRLQRGPADSFVVQRLYLAALSRPPTSAELNTARGLLRRSSEPISVMQDIFWALLNSNEFILNH